MLLSMNFSICDNSLVGLSSEQGLSFFRVANILRMNDKDNRDICEECMMSIVNEERDYEHREVRSIRERHSRREQ